MDNKKLTAFKKFFTLVFKKSTFYQEKYKKAGITSADKIQTWEDFVALPLTTRQELANNQMRHPPLGTNLTQPQDSYTYLMYTSGTTTGQPLFQPLTLREFDRYSRVLEYGDRLLGISKNDIFCHFTPTYFYPLSLRAIQRIGARMVPGPQNLEDLLYFLQKMRVTVLQTYPSVIHQLIEIAQRRRFQVKNLSLRLLITTGEPGGGDPKTKKLFERQFNTRVVDHIGSTEACITAIQCSRSEYHLVDKFFIAEVIDPVTKKHATKGELVLTLLWRRDLPFIRYKTGDLVEIDRTPCFCGNTSPKLRGGVLGRIDGLKKLRALLIYPEELERIIRTFSAVLDYRIILKNEHGLDEVDIFVELPLTTTHNYLMSLKHSVEAKLGFSPHIFPLFPFSFSRFGFQKSKRVFDQRQTALVAFNYPKITSWTFSKVLILNNKREKLKQILQLVLRLIP